MAGNGAKPKPAELPRTGAEGAGQARPTERLTALSLATLGVVFGDIGTSPLYAFRQSLAGTSTLVLQESTVLGVLSLILWALILVISVKYLIFMLRADNDGEGGILVLLALLQPWQDTSFRSRRILIALGLFGGALLYGDGVITPAISVLSAMEGLGVAAPSLQPYVVPLTITVLVLLFLFQRKGTASVGAAFGPVMLIWFVVLAALGLASILRTPDVLFAVDPTYAASFLIANRWDGFLILGAVFLVVTGGEALYADMGHFGRLPIRTAWFCLVFPALTLNYFGQGALVLRNGSAASSPFFHLAPAWAAFPLIILATLATVIASQAVITGAFSLTRQAVQLGQCPRMAIVQTSPDAVGQVYVPAVNWLLMALTLALVLGFGSSDALAGAYGIAITSTMVITSILAFFVMRRRWKWHPALAGSMVAAFLFVDLSFFGANLPKIVNGGWFPLLLAGVVFLLMSTWRRGRTILNFRLRENLIPLDACLERLDEKPPARVPGIAVFMTGRIEGTPPMLIHHLEHNQVLHDTVVLLTVCTRGVPRVPAADRLVVERFPRQFYRVFVHYGFMQSPNLPVALRECERLGLKIDLEKTTYYLGRETLIPASSDIMSRWRKSLFALMSRNATPATAFYSIPPERVIEIGLQVEL